MALKQNLPLFTLLTLIALVLAYLRLLPKEPAPTTYETCLVDKRSSIDIQSGSCTGFDGIRFAPSPTPAPPTPTPQTTGVVPVGWQKIALPLTVFYLPEDFRQVSSGSAGISYEGTASNSANLRLTVSQKEVTDDLDSFVDVYLATLPGNSDDWVRTPIKIDDQNALFLANTDYGFEAFVIEPVQNKLLTFSFNPDFNSEAALGEQILNSITFPAPN
jgi:hypothetical protein